MKATHVTAGHATTGRMQKRSIRSHPASIVALLNIARYLGLEFPALEFVKAA